jgi:hypothetical protein
MTDQPIDHRAEAANWLEAAQDGYFLTPPDERRDDWALTAALIGIGHALLAAFPDDDGGWEGLPPGTTEEPE